MGGAPPLPHNFAPQGPKRWSFSAFLDRGSPESRIPGKLGPQGSFFRGSVRRLARRAPSARGTPDFGVADEKGSGSPYEDAMKPERTPPKERSPLLEVAACGLSGDSLLEGYARRVWTPMW